MKEVLINRTDIQKKIPFFKGRFGGFLLNRLFSLLGVNKVNMIYDRSKQYTGLEFVDDMLDKLEIKRVIENFEVIDRFEGKPFITVSNHPYGHVDGIMLISAVASKRPDFKVMVNWLLSQIDTMEDHFIGVNPYSKGSKMAEAASSLSGVKQCILHLKEGHSLGFFPNAGVSTNYLTKTEDNPWRPEVLKLIQKAKVPIIPVFISGNNSWIYRTIGFFSWKLRTARLLHEVTNKKGKTIYLRMGEPIMPNEQAQFKDIEVFGKMLKDKTYALKKKGD